MTSMVLTASSYGILHTLERCSGVMPWERPAVTAAIVASNTSHPASSNEVLPIAMPIVDIRALLEAPAENKSGSYEAFVLARSARIPSWLSLQTSSSVSMSPSWG